MADTLRQTILSKIGEVLEGVSGVEKVEIERSTPVDIDTIPFATCFVYSGPEERATDDRSTIGFETFDWTVVIEVWVRNDDCETLLGAIHKAMFNNYSFGGYALNSKRKAVTMELLDVSKELKAMVVQYSVLYRHLNGQPDKLS